MTTICANCAYFYNRRPGSRLWHNAVCLEPKAQPVRNPDYTFGGLCEPETVHCRDVNKSGECPYFKPKP